MAQPLQVHPAVSNRRASTPQAAANSSPAQQPTVHTAAARQPAASHHRGPAHTLAPPSHPPAGARPSLPLLHLSHGPLARALELRRISCLIRARVGAESQRKARHQVLGGRLVRAAGPDHKLLRGGHARSRDGACGGSDGGGGGGRSKRLSGRCYRSSHRLMVSVQCTRSAAQVALGPCPQAPLLGSAGARLQAPHPTYS